MFEELLKKLAASLNKHEIPYMIIGGQALLAYGEPRLTKDIDITLGLDISRLDEVLEIAKTCGLITLIDNIEPFVKKTMVLPAADAGTGIRVDFIFSFSEYEKQALNRINKIKLDDIEARFASIEDLIIHKVVAGRPRDIEDVKILLIKGRNIDQAYISHWLGEFDVALSRSFIKTFRKIIKEIKRKKEK